jgi:membrane-anchored protein YejM (alkaline phosphatase superfamily)
MPLSADQITQALSRQGDDPWIALLSLQHDSMNAGVPVRMARNPSHDVVSNGLTFHRSWFEIEMPSDDETPAQCRVSIQNVDGEIGRFLETLIGPIECTIQVVLASDPDTYGREFLHFKLRNTSWDALNATGDLSQATITNNRWPKYQVTPKFFSHLFA